jgi:serine/threonine protein kinase
MESENLRELSAQNNPHLVHRIAAVALGEQYLILSDWANGHDLKHFWKQTPKPSVSATLVRNVVEQLTGLASAIKLMHHGYQAGTPSRSVSHSPPLLAVPTSVAIPVIVSPDAEAGRAPEIVAAGGNLSWRHGDLKPENILRFCKPGELVGTLCISDVGLAKRHIVATGVRKDASTTRFATLAYEPPEAVTRIDAPTSRRYDIWSFGCIMLEFVVWLLYGHEGLDDFWKLPKEKKGTLFWSPRDVESRAVVNRYVTQIMDEVLATNATCRPPSAIGDLLVLVKERVLVPALSGDNTALLQRPRIDAGELLKELQKIKDKCKNSEYCYSGPPGHNARLPVVSLLRNTSGSLHPPGAAMAQRVNS